jgi:peroxiredoxin
MSIRIGDKVPALALYDTERQLRSLSEEAGKPVVLLFFPGAFTGVCTKEMCTFRDSLAAYNALGAQVFGISVDTPASLKAFSLANALQFPLLSDFAREATTKFGVVLRDFGGVTGLHVAQRSVFVLDKDGVVRYAWVAEHADLEPDYEEVKAAVSSL